jgi:hypothetical protein
VANKNNKLLIFYFVSSLLIPALFGLFLPKNTNSLIEQRRLANLPEHPSSMNDLIRWKQQIEKYYQDHFGLRYSYLYLFRHLKYLIGDSPADLAIFGNKKGWLFYNRKTDGDIIGDYRNINQYTRNQLESMIQHLKSKQQWLANQGIEYLFVLAPSKHYIYPEYLPDHVTRVNQINLSDQLANELINHPEIHFIYLKPKLIRAKNSSNELLYYKADSHWNYYGANVAQYEIAKTIQRLFPNKIQADANLMKSINYETHHGDHSRYMGIESYFEESIATPKLNKCATENKPNDLEFNKTFSTHCLATGLKTIVFRDSYFSNLQPFISTYFNKATFVWSKMKFNTAQTFIDEDKPDLIIEEWVDRYLPDTFSPN